MSGRRNIINLTIALCLCAGSAMNGYALSEGYVLSSAFSSSTTELFDKNGNVYFSWKHIIPADTIPATDSTPRIINRSVTFPSGYSCYLLENGNLLRSCHPQGLKVGPGAAPVNGVLQEVDLDGNIIWADTIADVNQSLHHDFKTIKQPDGSYHILAVSFVTLTREAGLAMGLDSSVFGTQASVQFEKIIEIKPDRTNGGNSEIVWEWHIIDHVAPKGEANAHPELFDGTHPTWGRFPQQWVHLNGIDYNADKKLIAFTSRVFSEVYVIERTATSDLAKGHSGGTYGKGGDLLYRWGHPSNYIVKTGLDTIIRPADTTIWRGDTIITPADTTINTIRLGHANDHINCLHCPTWVPKGYRNEGNIMFYHNNVNDMMTQLGCSQAVEINPWNAGGTLHPTVAGSPTDPQQPTWVYNSLDSMFSMSMSSAIRMKNGNTLVHTTYPGGNNAGNNSTIREVDPNGQLVGSVTELTPLSAETEKSSFMAKSYNSPKVMYYPEDYPGIIAVKTKKGVAIGNRSRARSGSVLPQPAIKPVTGAVAFSEVAGAVISIYSLQGKRIMSLRPSVDAVTLSTSSLAAGTYLIRVRMTGREVIGRTITILP